MNPILAFAQIELFVESLAFGWPHSCQVALVADWTELVQVLAISADLDRGTGSLEEAIFDDGLTVVTDEAEVAFEGAARLKHASLEAIRTRGAKNAVAMDEVIALVAWDHQVSVVE
jgi:hypothetical protein